MEKNKLPEGVGRKIVEALKKQSEIDVIHSQDELESIDDLNLNSDENENVFETLNNQAIEINQVEDKHDLFEVPEQEEEVTVQPLKNTVENENISDFSSNWNVNSNLIDETFANQMNNFQVNSAANQSSASQTSNSGMKTFDMPPNVAVLKRLISQLPAGVTKQTGAQIIKQTMEALGISMNTVLHEAQKIQEELNEATKDCSSTIQEYINNIKVLEKQANDYQRQSNQLNDLISLFVLVEK